MTVTNYHFIKQNVRLAPDLLLAGRKTQYPVKVLENILKIKISKIFKFDFDKVEC